MSTHNDLRLEQIGRFGVITLNRPNALNSLTHDMVRAIAAALADWRLNGEIHAVLIRGAGDRAFCAGGDVRDIARKVTEGRLDEARAFFADEYRQNWRVKRFPKPYVALMNGVVMGGGVGDSIHGDLRVVSEKTVFAMPETGIGLFPDVGGTYALPRLPGELGMYLGLTGARLGAADCLYAGIGTHFVPSARMDELAEALLSLDDAREAQLITRAIARFAADPGEAPIAACQETIDRLFAGTDLNTIRTRLRVTPGFAQEQAAVLEEKAPFSVALTFAALRFGATLEFEDCQKLEYRMVSRIIARPDFAEGIRALLIDKDKQPKWQPATIDLVDAGEVAAMSRELDDGDLRLDWH